MKRSVLLAAFSAFLFAGACSGPTERQVPTLDQETFIEVFVALRTANLQSPTPAILQAQRNEVLQRFQVSEQDLLDFAEYYGRDPVTMDQIWTAVEGRLGELTEENDSIN